MNLYRVSAKLRPSLGLFHIVLLLLSSFQFSAWGVLHAVAAEKLPVLQLSTLEDQQFSPVLKALRASGYEPEVLEEKRFQQTVPLSHYLMVPLDKDLNEKTLTALSRFMARGGKLILIAPEEYPESTVSRLMQGMGISVAGSAFASQALDLQWKGKAAPLSADTLPVGTSILAITPNSQTDVKATWGKDYPAVIRTGKGALLNWQWGRQLSNETNRIALSGIIPIASANLASAQAAEPKKNTVTEPAGKKPEPVKAKQAPAVATSAEPAKIAPAEKPKAASVAHKPVTQKAGQPQPLMPLAAPNAVKTQKPAAPPEIAQAPAPAAEEKTGAELREEMEAAAVGAPEPKKQKHYSFLDPEAMQDLAPEFDYGVYSYNMRVLDDYKRRINDAIETSRQLALDLPIKKVEMLLQQSNEHKKQFETLYLNNNTMTGLEEYEKARKLALQALALTSASPKIEGRAIWLDRGTIVEARTPEKLRLLMQKMHRAGINIIYFETLNAGFPIYPSKILKPNPLIEGWDPLQVAIQEGHRLGMEVHAWVWAFAVGNRRHNDVIGMPNDYPGPILVEAGLQSEAMQNASGGYLPDSKQTEFWLSPASPKAREFLLSVYKEIVSNYDVDGLQLDYIRYPFQSASTQMGFEPVGRERFAKSTGVTLDGSMDDYKRKLWTAWKTYQVSSFVQQVSETLKKIKPTLRLSAAVFPMKRETRIVAIQQDWETWVDNGWIDTLSPMSYTRDPEKLSQMYRYVTSSPQKRTIVYPGIALNKIDPGTLTLELETLRDQGSMGSTLFAGAHLDEDKVEILGNGPFKEKTSLPPHRDPVASMRTILEDYQEKLAKLRVNGQLVGNPADADAVRSQIDRLATTLRGMGGDGSTITPKLGEAHQQLKTLKVVTNQWLSQDRLSHPFRAQYFDQSVLLLENLLGYLSDRFGLSLESITKKPQSANEQPVSYDAKPDEDLIQTGL